MPMYRRCRNGRNLFKPNSFVFLCSFFKLKGAEDAATVVGDAGVLSETADDAETDGGDDRQADGAAAPETVAMATEPATKAALETDGEACGTYAAEGEAVIETNASLDGAGAGEGEFCQVCMRRTLEVSLQSKFTHTISDDASVRHKKYRIVRKSD